MLDDLIKSLHDEDRRIAFFIIGRTGAGKTTLAHELNKQADFPFVSPGTECRQKFGDQFFAEKDNPLAPPESEQFVRERVGDTLAKGERCVVIDGFPRSEEQVRWAHQTSKSMGRYARFGYCYCDPAERKVRLEARDKADSAKALSARRNETEGSFILRVFEEINYWGVKVMMLDSSPHRPELLGRNWHDEIHDPFEHVEPDIGLKTLFRLHNDLNDLILSRHNTSSSMLLAGGRRNAAGSSSESVVWLRRFVKAIKDEADELLQELPTSWWARDKADMRAARVELVDILHFFLSAVTASGMRPQDLFSFYMDKRHVNIKRQKRGYIKAAPNHGKDDIFIGGIERGKPCIYLGGPIFSGQSKGEFTDPWARKWREALTDALGDIVEVLNPLTRRSTEGLDPLCPEHWEHFVKGDMADIRASDLLVVFMPKVSAGASMEMLFARQHGIPTMLIVPGEQERLSVWLNHFADVVIEIKTTVIETIADAVRKWLEENWQTS